LDPPDGAALQLVILNVLGAALQRLAQPFELDSSPELLNSSKSMLSGVFEVLMDC